MAFMATVNIYSFSFFFDHEIDTIDTLLLFLGIRYENLARFQHFFLIDKLKKLTLANYLKIAKTMTGGDGGSLGAVGQFSIHVIAIIHSKISLKKK